MYTDTWILYGTAGCHLCDEAAAICTQAGIIVTLVDICDDTFLLESMGLYIPVLAPNRHCAQTDWLKWPFDVDTVLAKSQRII